MRPNIKKHVTLNRISAINAARYRVFSAISSVHNLWLSEENIWIIENVGSPLRMKPKGTRMETIICAKQK